MNYFVDDRRLHDQNIVKRVLRVTGSLDVVIDGQIIINPNFEFSLSVQSGIELIDGNCRKFIEQLLVGQ